MVADEINLLTEPNYTCNLKEEKSLSNLCSLKSIIRYSRNQLKQLLTDFSVTSLYLISFYLFQDNKK